MRSIALGLGLSVTLIAAGCSSGGGDAAADKTTYTAAAGLAKTFGDPTAIGYTPTGELVADNGFRPEKDGFSFENYGPVPDPALTNLTAADLQKAFGEQVCASTAGGTCILTPPAQAWLDQENQGMAGGHCYGFSVASELFFQGKETASTFGAATTPELKIEGNEALSRQLAYAFEFQGLQSVKSKQIGGTPKEVLEKLRAALVKDAPETYTIGIYKRAGDGGHAVTPYAIEDHGGGVFSILIYDNNYPGVTRQITVDTNADTWQYIASTNPKEPSELYEGDATTGSLVILPTSPGVGVQPCPFCGDQPANDAAAGLGSAKGVTTTSAGGGVATDLDLVYLESGLKQHGHLLITDDAGHKIGYDDGKLVNTMPGAEIDRSLSNDNWTSSIEPDYLVPTGGTYTITLDGAALKESDKESIGIISDSFEASVDDIALDPGQRDVMVVGPYATTLSYNTTQAESPSIEVGYNGDEGTSLVFDVSGESYEAGSTVNLHLPLDGSGFGIDTAAESGDSTFNLTMTYIDKDGEIEFTHNDVELKGEDSAVLQFGSYDKDGEGIPFVVTHDGVATTETLTDG